MKTPIGYIEFPTHDITSAKQFYGEVFGWTFEDWGPDYAAFDEGLAGGFNGSGDANDHRTRVPLVVLQTTDLEAMLARVTAAGGQITVGVFTYPGGRRFHFTDPSGQELAVMQPA